MSEVKEPKEYAFDVFVKDEKDIQGMFAYYLYKKDKRDTIIHHRNITGKSYEAKEIEELQRSLLCNREKYKKEARRLMVGVSLAITNSVKQEFEAKISEQNKIIADLKNKCPLTEKEEKGFFYGVGQSIVGSFALILLGSILAFWLNFGDIGSIIIDIFKTGAAHYKIEQEA